MVYQIFELAEERGRKINQIWGRLFNVTGQAEGAHPGGGKVVLEFRPE